MHRILFAAITTLAAFLVALPGTSRQAEAGVRGFAGGGKSASFRGFRAGPRGYRFSRRARPRGIGRQRLRRKDIPIGLRGPRVRIIYRSGRRGMRSRSARFRKYGGRGMSRRVSRGKNSKIIGFSRQQFGRRLGPVRGGAEVVGSLANGRVQSKAVRRMKSGRIVKRIMARRVSASGRSTRSVQTSQYIRRADDRSMNPYIRRAR